MCVCVLLVLTLQSARSRSKSLVDIALQSIALPLELQDNGKPELLQGNTLGSRWSFYWRSSTQALLVDQSGGLASAQYRILTLKKDGAAETEPLPASLVQKMQTGNMLMSIAPHGDFFLVIEDTAKLHHVTEIAADGTEVGQWRSKNTLLDACVFAASGPGWVEFHGAFDRQEHGDYFVHYPGKPDIRIQEQDREAPELHSNGQGEIFSVGTDYNSTGKLDTFLYMGVWQKPGTARQVSLRLPADYQIINVTANPVNSDVLLGIYVPETPVFTNKWLRRVPFLRSRIHPAKTVIMRCKSDGSGLVEIGEMSPTPAFKYSFQAAKPSWLPDSKRFSVTVGRNLYICNAYE
jgi:hypothetical protein